MKTSIILAALVLTSAQAQAAPLTKTINTRISEIGTERELVLGAGFGPFTLFIGLDRDSGTNVTFCTLDVATRDGTTLNVVGYNVETERSLIELPIEVAAAYDYGGLAFAPVGTFLVAARSRRFA